LSRQLRLDVAQLTDVGRKRPHNEDNMAYVIPKDEQVMARKGALFIVADGMGGHAAGEVASEIAVETVTIAYYQDESEDILLSLMNAIKRANAIIHQRAAENMLRTGMGTTCVSAVLLGNVAYIANVGDSRAYLVRRGQVRQISQDHSWVEEQVRAGLLTRDQARSHAHRNVITRCLGTQAEVEVDVFSEALEEGDTFVLCSDGLSGFIAEDDLRAIAQQYVPQESVYHLVERANENGGADNITAIVVRVQEVGSAEMSATTTRQLVPVGASDDEDTLVLGRTSSSSSGSSTRADDSRAASSSSPSSTTGSLRPSGSGNTAPLPGGGDKKRPHRRLLYPTLALVIVLLVAFAGGGAYYFLFLQRDVNHQLDSVASLLSQAGSTSDPAQALRSLASAQTQLREVSGNGTVLVGSQTTRAAELQDELTAKTKKSIADYNKSNTILSLSTCSVSQSSTITTPANTTPSSLVAVQDEKQNVGSYVLANEANNANGTTALYPLDAKKNLVSKQAFDNAQPILTTGQGSWLFVVTKATQGNAAYKLLAFKRNLDGTLKSPDDHTPRDIPAAALSTNKQPQLITAWGDDVYLFFYATDSWGAVTILHYNVANWDKVETSEAQVSFPLRSVAALPDKTLVLLTSDGRVQRSLFNVGASTLQQFSLSAAVPTPVGVEAQDFTWNTGFTAPPEKSTQTQFLIVPDASLVVVGKTGNNVNLFIVDDSHHRVIQLEYLATQPAQPQATPPADATAAPSATPTAQTGGGMIAQPQLKYTRQLMSASVLPAVKSIAVDPKNGGLSLLTLPARQPAALTSIDIAKASTCSSAS
jgi:serine/threonine protein phosphatase PrpC